MAALTLRRHTPGLRKAFAAGVAIAGLLAASPAPAQAANANDIPRGWTAKAVEPIGYVALDAVEAFKLGLKRVGQRWFLFVGEGGIGVEERTGFRVVDVTDPTRPRSLVHEAVPNGNGQITLNGDLLIVGRHLPLPPHSAGSSMAYPFKGAPAAVPTALASFYDISDPARPRKLSDWV